MNPLLLLIAGMAMGLATPPLPLWGLAWIALAPLWVMVRQARGRIFLAMKWGTLWGMAYHGVALRWLIGWHPLTWLGINWWASLAIVLSAFTAVILWGAAISALWAGGMAVLDRVWSKRCLSSPGSWTARIWLALLHLLSGISLWCGLEWLWSRSFLWWTSLSLTQSPADRWILHLGQLSGPNTVVAALVLVNGLWAEIWLLSRSLRATGQKAPMALYLIPLSCCLALHLLGGWLAEQPLITSAETALKVGIIQGNVPSSIKFSPQGLRQTIDRYSRGYQQLADQGVEGVLTPEGALPLVWTDPANRQLSAFQQTLRDRGVVLWLGSFGRKEQRITQSLFTVTAASPTYGRYNKVKLVPLGEYIPFEGLLGDLVQRFSPVNLGMKPGAWDQHLETPFGRAIASICYDSAFSTLFQTQAAAGGQFILSASNNDSFRSTAMMAQHHAQDVMRAIETDRWAVRATNTGYSGLVDPHGQTHWLSTANTYTLHAATIYRRQTQTYYVRWGDWLTPVLVMGVVLVYYFHR
uniref:Apolipoprotein N-acyltransferase n=1 Tax=Cyanothece sp. (strain PCC 7425 / ATCC 29141) TaxID=395961 RepID=B8HXU5_CYAP4